MSDLRHKSDTSLLGGDSNGTAWLLRPSRIIKGWLNRRASGSGPEDGGSIPSPFRRRYRLPVVTGVWILFIPISVRTQTSCSDGQRNKTINAACQILVQSLPPD